MRTKREDVVARIEQIAREASVPGEAVPDWVEDVMDLIDSYVDSELALNDLAIAEEMTARASRFVKATRAARQTAHDDSLARAKARTILMPIVDAAGVAVGTAEVPA